MRQIHRRRSLPVALALLCAVAGSPPVAAAATYSGGEGKLSFDLSLPLALLEAAGPDSEFRISCDTASDADTAAMIGALQRQGRRGVVRGRDDDGRWEARRRGDRFELRAWNMAEHQKLYLALPWPLADCLLGGGGRRELTSRDLFGHRYEVRFESEWSRIRFTLD